MQPTILLLQARNGSDPAKNEERASFAQKAKFDQTRIVPHDIIAEPLTLKKVRKFDALMVGGSGDYYVSKANLPHFEETLEVLQDVVAIGHPTFASCFGFQLMVRALGGEVMFDPPTMEVGTYRLALTPAGQQDELLGTLPANFCAQLGRKDRATQLPDGCVHLASSERCPYQAMRLPGKPIWATQFHPELSGSENRARFLRYQAGYGSVMNEDEQQATLDRFKESPETEQLIEKFVGLVFG
jgi:GMP synthase (glutamine-hydrolysing)